MPTIIPVDDPLDPRIEAYRDVRERDLTGRAGQFIAEGEVVLRVLLTASRHEAVSVLIAAKRLAALTPLLKTLPDIVPVYVAGQSVIDRIAGFPLHRGILALGRRGAMPAAAELLNSAGRRAVFDVPAGCAPVSGKNACKNKGLEHFPVRHASANVEVTPIGRRKCNQENELEPRSEATGAGKALGPHSEATRTNEALVVVLFGIANHDNIGGIFRNAAAFGADAVILDAGCCDPLYRKAIRVSVGACLTVPFARLPPGEDAVAILTRCGFEAIALSPSGATPLARLERPARVAVLLGTEGAGLPAEVLARVRTVSIPMANGFDSLNVATTSGIVLHHLAFTSV